MKTTYSPEALPRRAATASVSSSLDLPGSTYSERMHQRRSATAARLGLASSRLRIALQCSEVPEATAVVVFLSCTGSRSKNLQTKLLVGTPSSQWAGEGSTRTMWTPKGSQNRVINPVVSHPRLRSL